MEEKLLHCIYFRVFFALFTTSCIQGMFLPAVSDDSSPVRKISIESRMIMDVDMIRKVVLHSLEVVWDIIRCQFKQQY